MPESNEVQADVATAASDVKSVAKEIIDAEITLLKGPLLNAAQALQAPGIDTLGAQNALVNIALQVPQLSGPAQTAAFNIIGEALQKWISNMGAPAANS